MFSIKGENMKVIGHHDNTVIMEDEHGEIRYFNEGNLADYFEKNKGISKKEFSKIIAETVIKNKTDYNYI